jgi:hypothetical protein
MRYAIAILAIFLITGCSAKTVEYDPFGNKTKITTQGTEHAYYSANQAVLTAWKTDGSKGKVIAEITSPDGIVTTIYSQLPDQIPLIPQYKNQIIEPAAEMVKWAIGGVVLDRGIRAVVKGAGDTIVDNAGDGTVYVDRSDSIASETNASFQTNADSSTTDTSDRSTMDNTDNSVMNQDDNSIRDSHDQTADPVIVMPETE